MCVGVDIMVGRTGEHFRVGIRILDHIDFLSVLYLIELLIGKVKILVRDPHVHEHLCYIFRQRSEVRTILGTHLPAVAHHLVQFGISMLRTVQSFILKKYLLK